MLQGENMDGEVSVSRPDETSVVCESVLLCFMGKK